MSSPASAAFTAASRLLTADLVTLASIRLVTPDDVTLYYATAETITPDGQLWATGLSCDAVRASLDFLSPGLNPVEATIRLAKRQDALQAIGTYAGSTVDAMLYQHVWQTAIVTIYVWETSLTSFSDALQVFQGVVSRPVEITADGMTLHLLQDQSWNKQTPPTVVDKIAYPDSPDVSQGLPIPILYGDFASPAMRSPWATSYGSKSKQEDSGAGLGVVPLVLVNAGVGASKVKLVAANHALKDLLERTDGHSAYIVGENLLSPLDTTGLTETITGPSTLEIADENAIAYAAIIPIDVRASENLAGDPRNAIDPFDETAYATLDQAGGKTLLQLILPNAASLGRIESVQYYVAYSGDAANANNMRIRSKTPGGGFGTTTANWAAASATPAVQAGTWAAADYNAPNWGFGDNGTAIFDVRIDFTGGATNKGRIYWVALVVKYRPQRSVVTPGKVVVLPQPGPRIGIHHRPIFKTKDIPTTFQLDSQFYACPKGYADDGGGTFTGVAAALIERPCDIANHFLQTYGLVSSGDIELGATATGSFVLARSTLRNAGPTDLKMAAWIGERTTVQRVLQKICEQSGMCIFQDRFTGTWLCFVWKPGAAVDYDRPLSWLNGDFMAFAAEETSVVDVSHALRVKYGFDHFKSKTLWEAFSNSSSSSQGKNLPTIRDQTLVVDATNEDIDWIQVAVGTFAATLAHATYTPIALAVEARTKMRTTLGNNNINCGYGFSIKTGFNDKIDVDANGGVAFVATLNEGDYTAEGLAAETLRAVNASAPAGFSLLTVNYDHPSNTFSITSATAFTFDGSSGAANYATTAVHVLGRSDHLARATTWGTNTPRYGNRFWFFSVGTFNMLWSSGVSAATNAAYLLGYPRTDSGNTSDNPATYSRGDRERTAATYEGYYGPREERQLIADWVRDENTAVELRDRTFDLTARPRTVARFSTRRCFDLRRMQIIQFSSDLDAVVAFPKYGSDGSWSGKPLRVLEVVQNLGPNYHQEVLAIDAA